jgi:hypothetical protein
MWTALKYFRDNFKIYNKCINLCFCCSLNPTNYDDNDDEDVHLLDENINTTKKNAEAYSTPVKRLV